MQLSESRITEIEQQLKDLLKWKNFFVQSLGMAIAANPHLTGHGVDHIPPPYTSTEKHTGNLYEIPMPVAAPRGPGQTVETVAAAPQLDQESAAHIELADKIINIIQAYGKHLPDDKADESQKVEWAGRAKFTPKVLHWVKKGEPIRMVLPAFPWKSVNRVDKVIGALPDFGEELALARLDALCKEVARVYEPGAEVHIATDGLVFNDLLGISDEDTWEYSVALMKMAADRGFHTIKILRVMDILGLTTGQTMTKELYLSTVTEARHQLSLQFANASADVRKLIKEDPDTMMTYCGFILFLRTDLKHSSVAAHVKNSNDYRRVTKEVAMGMMIRAESFTKIILAHLDAYVRLSVHPSSGAVKLSIPLVPQRGGGGDGARSWPRTPWHCSIAVGVDGSYQTVHAKDVRATHRLVERDGRPYFFRERSPLYDWEDDVVEFEHLYPQGMVVRPKERGSGRALMLSDVQLGRLRSLAARQGGVRVEGFEGIEDGEIVPVAES